MRIIKLIAKKKGDGKGNFTTTAYIKVYKFIRQTRAALLLCHVRSYFSQFNIYYIFIIIYFFINLFHKKQFQKICFRSVHMELSLMKFICPNLSF